MQRTTDQTVDETRGEEAEPTEDAVDRLLMGLKHIIEEQNRKKELNKKSWSLTTIATLVALIISVSTASWTIYEKFLSQPSPSLISPTIANLYCRHVRTANGDFRCQEGGALEVRAGQFHFVNESAAANTYLITDGWVTVNFLLNETQTREPISLRWQFFSDATNSGNPRSSAAPIEVSTLQRESREIEFTARRTTLPDGSVGFPDRVLFEDFLGLIAASQVDEIRLDFEFSVYQSNDTLLANCSIVVAQDFIDNAASGEFVLFSRDCN